jgi:hypothetical protein
MSKKEVERQKKDGGRENKRKRVRERESNGKSKRV